MDSKPIEITSEMRYKTNRKFSMDTLITSIIYQDQNKWMIFEQVYHFKVETQNVITFLLSSFSVTN